MKTKLQLKNLSVGYGSKVILDGVNAQLSEGQSIAVIGPNGAGKSTLLRSILGIEPVLSGSIDLKNEPLSKWSHSERASAMSALLTERVAHGAWNVSEILQVGVSRETLSETERKHWLAALQLEKCMGQQVSTLSSGESQRVMLLRCLAQSQDLWVMDEPTANLDPGMSALVMRDLRERVKSSSSSLLFSTHDLSTAINYADSLWLCYDGRVEVLDPNEAGLAQRFDAVFGQSGLRFDRELMRFVSS